MNTLDDRIHQTVTTMLRAAPDPLPFEQLSAPRVVREARPLGLRRRNLVAAVGALGVVAAIVGIAVLVSYGETTGTPTSTSSGLPTYQRTEYSQSIGASCNDDAPPLSSGEFDAMTFESWADHDGRRYRMRVTYPDGSTRDVVALGDPWSPTELYVRGEARGRRVLCSDHRSTGGEPGDAAFWSLSPMAEIPRRPDGVPQVLQYSDLGVREPGRTEDSRGRAADLWRSAVSGTHESSAGDVRALRQENNWFVDPATGLVLERNWSEDIEGASSFSSREVLVLSDHRAASDAMFATDGYGLVRAQPNPATPSSTGSPTTLGS